MLNLATISVNADDVLTDYADGEITVGNLRSVHVAVNEDGDASTHRCAECNETSSDPDYDEVCPELDTRTVDLETCELVEDPDDPAEGHAWDAIPHAWLNSAGISFNDSDDSVTVTVSVGDPRGAFALVIRRVPDDADSKLAGKLIMHVPYPGESMAHMPLRRLHEGTYIVGDDASA